MMPLILKHRIYRTVCSISLRIWLRRGGARRTWLSGEDLGVALPGAGGPGGTDEGVGDGGTQLAAALLNEEKAAG